MIARLVVVLLVMLAAGARAQTPPLMPRPVVLPDVGAHCPGWLPCPPRDEIAASLHVDGWYAPIAAPQRGVAGGVRAAAIWGFAHRLEVAVSGAVLSWEPANPTQPRQVGWNEAGLHARVIVWPLSDPRGRWNLTAGYSHEWAPGSVGHGLLRPGATLGTGRLWLDVPLWLLHLGAGAAVSYDPGTGAAAAELGARVLFAPMDEDHRIQMYAEGAVRAGVRGEGGLSGWGAFGVASLSRDGGLAAGGGVLLGAGDQAPILFVLRVSEHLGKGYRPPDVLPRPAEPAPAAQPRPRPAYPWGELLDRGSAQPLHLLDVPTTAAEADPAGPSHGPALASLSPWEVHDPSGMRLPPRRPVLPGGMHLLDEPPPPPRATVQEPPPAPRPPPIGQILEGPAEPRPPPRPPEYRVIPREADSAVHAPPPGAAAQQRGEAVHEQPPQRPYMGFTKRGKEQLDGENAAAHSGVNRCKNCGVQVVPGQRSRAGVRPPDEERQRDHVVPRSKGGSGTPDNGQILCRKCNLEKGNK